MKIIICTRDLSYGAGSHVKGLLKAFESNPEIGKILVLGPQKLEGFSPKIEFELIKVRGGLFITKEPVFAMECRRRLVKILKNEDYGLIHTHFPILAKDFGIPLVATFHTTHRELSGLKYDRPLAMWVGRFFHSVYDFFDRVTFKHAGRIIFVSQNTRDRVLEYRPYLEGKSVHIPNGVDIDRFKPLPGEERESLKRKYGLDKREANLLFVGRLEYGKGLSYLIEACKGIPGINLMVVGDGLLEKELSKYPFVRHFKDIPHQRMNDIYNMAEVYVLPSLYENCPATILEAMACGLPVISTPVGDVSAMLPEGNPIIPLRNVPKLREAIQSIIRSDKELLKRIGNLNAQKARQNYGSRDIAQKVFQLYGKTVKR